jgi:hypothetical protein
MREPPATIKHLIWRKHSRKTLCAEAPPGDAIFPFPMLLQHPPSRVISGISTNLVMNIQLELRQFCISLSVLRHFGRETSFIFVTLLL